MNISSFKENKVVKILLNKFVLTGIIFVILFLVSPNNNITYRYKVKKQYEEVAKKKNFILEEIQQDSIRIADLEKNIKAKERYGREKYLMKAANEDIYVIKQQENTLSQTE
jgi:hypothetical protein